MHAILTASATLLALTALPALAAPKDAIPLTYETFEEAVPHVDLETCPAELAAEAVFCRATLANDAIHVFAFSEDGDLPLVGVASFDAGALPALLK